MFLQISPVSNKLNNKMSFKSNALKDTYDDLNSAVNHEIIPLMRDSKPLYYSVAKIGYAFQNTAKLYQKLETELWQHKIDMLVKNPFTDNKNASKILSFTQKLEQNQKNYERYAKMSKMPLYNQNTNLRKKVEEASVLYKQNDNLKNLVAFEKAFETARDEMDANLEKISVKNKFPELFEKMKDCNEKYIEAISFMWLNPYNDALNLTKEMNDIGNLLKNPKNGYVSLLNRLEAAQHSFGNIVRSKKSFYDNKSDIDKYIETNKNAQNNLPDDDSMKRFYAELKLDCDKQFDCLQRKLKSEFKHIFDENSDIDFSEYENLTEKQALANNEIAEIMEEIKRSYIANRYEDMKTDC